MKAAGRGSSSRRRLAVACIVAVLVAGFLAPRTGDDGLFDLVGPGTDEPGEENATDPAVPDDAEQPGDDDGEPGTGAPPASGGTDGPVGRVPVDEPDRPRSARTIDLAGAGVPVSAGAGVERGVYLVTATVSGRGARVRITMGGDRVGEYTVDGADRGLEALVHVSGPDDRIGVDVVTTASEPSQASVARIHLAPEAAMFTTRGATILDPAGRRFIVRGVNRTGLNVSARPENMNRSDFAAMVDWGANAVRLKLGQHIWLPAFCAHDDAYVAAVDRAVQAITDLGMVALLDLAWTTADQRCGEPGLQRMPDRYSVEFWRAVATRYKDDPLVAFGIFNEPYGVKGGVWRNGGAVSEPTGGLLGDERTWKAVGMQRLYEVVRSTGARNVVYVSGPGFSHDIRAAVNHPLDGYGLVYGPHVYCPECDGQHPSSLATGVQPVVGDYPVVITEFGSTDQSPTFNQQVIDWAEARGLGWMAFMWAPTSTGAFGLLDSWDTYAPSPGGRPVRAALRRAS